MAKESKTRSGLEKFAWELLEKEGIPFEYEPKSVTLVPSFSFENISYEKRGKTFKLANTNIRAITYKPDFVGDNWVMETKGYRRPAFDLRWKMYKRVLASENSEILLLMPSNQDEVKACVNIIKQWSIGNREVLQLSENIELLTIRSPKSKVSKTKDGQSTVKRRHPVIKNRKRARLPADLPF